jgi:hypothetical protein
MTLAEMEVRMRHPKAGKSDSPRVAVAHVNSPLARRLANSVRLNQGVRVVAPSSQMPILP